MFNDFDIVNEAGAIIIVYNVTAKCVMVNLNMILVRYFLKNTHSLDQDSLSTKSNRCFISHNCLHKSLLQKKASMLMQSAHVHCLQPDMTPATASSLLLTLHYSLHQHFSSTSLPSFNTSATHPPTTSSSTFNSAMLPETQSPAIPGRAWKCPLSSPSLYRLN